MGCGPGDWYRPIRSSSGVLSNVWVKSGTDLVHAFWNMAARVQAVAKTVGLMHKRGLIHKEPHLRQFHVRGETAWVSDFDRVESSGSETLPCSSSSG